MKRVSSSATYLALFRAVETARTSHDRLFEDPFAVSLLPIPLRVIPASARTRFMTKFLNWAFDRGWHPRSSAVIRTRMIDDFVKHAQHEGLKQLLILGAGFDSRPYRMPELSGVPVFEVDRYVTQWAKQSRLRKTLPHMPANVRFLAADVEKCDLRPRLIHSGFNAKVKSIVLAEGLISHLSKSAADRIFALMSELASIGSYVVFTYVHSDELQRSGTFREHRWRWWARVNGEPFRFGFYPEELYGYLALHGFRLLADRSTAEAARDYVPNSQGRRESGCAFYHVAVAIKDR